MDEWMCERGKKQTLAAIAARSGIIWHRGRKTGKRKNSVVEVFQYYSNIDPGHTYITPEVVSTLTHCR